MGTIFLRSHLNGAEKSERDAAHHVEYACVTTHTQIDYVDPLYHADGSSHALRFAYKYMFFAYRINIHLAWNMIHINHTHTAHGKHILPPHPQIFCQIFDQIFD